MGEYLHRIVKYVKREWDPREPKNLAKIFCLAAMGVGAGYLYINGLPSEKLRKQKQRPTVVSSELEDEIRRE